MSERYRLDQAELLSALLDTVDPVRNGALDYLQNLFSQDRLLRLLPVIAERHNNGATRHLIDPYIPGGQREQEQDN